MADEADSKSVVGNNVWVQVPLPELKNAEKAGSLDRVFDNSEFYPNVLLFCFVK